MISLGFSNPSYDGKFTKKFERIQPKSSEELADIVVNKDCKYWSPILFKNNLRKSDNFEKSFLIVLDIDETTSLSEALELIKYNDLHSIVATTRHHQEKKGNKPPADRFRIVLFADSWCVDLQRYLHTVRKYNAFFSGDTSATLGSQFFWPCREIVTITSGSKISWENPPAKKEKLRKKTIKTNSLIPDKYVINLLTMKKLAKSGSRHSTLFHVCSYMTSLGFDSDTIELYVTNSKLGKTLISEDGYEEIKRHIENGARAGKTSNSQ